MERDAKRLHTTPYGVLLNRFRGPKAWCEGSAHLDSNTVALEFTGGLGGGCAEAELVENSGVFAAAERDMATVEVKHGRVFALVGLTP